MIQRTIFGVAPIRTSVLGVGAALTLLFTAVEPASSAGLGFLPRLLFWALHVGLGLGCLLLVSVVIRHFGAAGWALWALIILSGLLGAVLATGPYWALERLFATQLGPEIVDDFWDRFGQRGIWQGIVAEFFGILPVFMSSWIALNLPLLFHRPTVYDPPDPPKETVSADWAREQKARRQALLESLPEVVGQELVAMSSDLHYLNVYTRLGQALVLGSLKKMAEAFGEEGLQVHRSHWVMKREVVRVFIGRDDAYCVMTTGLRVPISRSNRKLVKACFGQLRRQSPITEVHQAKA